MSSSNGSLVTTMKPKSKYQYGFHAVVILHLYENDASSKAAYFSNISYHKSFQELNLNFT
jgi:hypothetical protein